MREELNHTLPDGRILSYAEYGDPKGRPVFFFHGMPGTQHQGRVTHKGAAEHGLRMLCPDRPGIGGSSLQPGRRLADWPSDVTALADALELPRFGVIGGSGGGPYAAACARFIPDRLTGVALMSGMGPLYAPNATRDLSGQTRVMFSLGRWFPRLMAWLTVATMKAAQRNPDKMFAQLGKALPPPDLRLVDDPGFRDAMMMGMKPGPNSVRGIAQEITILTKPWGFDLHDIEIEVHVFHGEQDRNVPPSLARWVVEQLPNVKAHFYPEEGHVSVFPNRGAEILGVFA